jgi:hypothetical protein
MDALRKSKWIKAYVRCAGLISGVVGIASAVLQTGDRTFKGGRLTLDDGMTLSGIFLLLSCAAMLPVDRWPWMKRVSGALGLPYVGLLFADGWGKPGFGGLAVNCILPTIFCFAMIFERKNHRPVEKRPKGRGPVAKYVAVYKASPMFCTAIVSTVLKILTLRYGLLNHETLFNFSVLCGMIENFSVGMTDNSVKKYFGVSPDTGGAALLE